MEERRVGRRERLQAAAGLTAAVLVALGASGAVSMMNADRDARRANELRRAYSTLRFNAVVERRAAQQARTGKRTAVGDLLGATRNVNDALAEAAANASSVDSTRVRSLTRRQQLATVEWSRFLAAKNAHDRVAARVHFGALDRALGTLAAGAQAGANDLRLRSVGRWPVTTFDYVRLASAGVVFLLGLVLALRPLVVLAGLRRREESARQEAMRRLERAARTDNLTRLGNHRAFHEDLKRAITIRNRTGAGFSLLMIDLNGLKRINDTHGHQAGDDRIKSVAECLAAAAGDAATAYRIGGDEFAIVVPGARAWGAVATAQSLHAAVGARKGYVSVSVGVAESTGTEAKDSVIRQADLALYEAKRSHLGTVVYSPSLEPTEAPAEVEAHRHHQKVLASALARAVDAKDAGTRNHCETVGELCAMIGRGLGLDNVHVEKLRLAGLLHDVGKIGIADSILQKPDELGVEESEIMRTHSQIGHNIVTAADLEQEADWVLHHHEWFDGSGYPDGLVGEDIPLESRIILVADAYEAITADRPYRAGRTPEEALDELRAHAGTQFDPACVAALCSLFGVAENAGGQSPGDGDELAARRRVRGLDAAPAAVAQRGTA